MQSVVRAVLRGMGRETECNLTLWTEQSLSGRKFTRCRISGEPGDLPDGSYTVSFEGHTVFTRKWSGEWMLNFLPSHIRVEDAA